MFMNGQIKLEVRIFVLVTFLLYSLSSRAMENKGKWTLRVVNQVWVLLPPICQQHHLIMKCFRRTLMCLFQIFNPNQRHFVSSDDAATQKFSTNNAK